MVMRQVLGQTLQLTPTLLHGTNRSEPGTLGEDQLAQGGAAGVVGAAHGKALEAAPRVGPVGTGCPELHGCASTGFAPSRHTTKAKSEME